MKQQSILQDKKSHHFGARLGECLSNDVELSLIETGSSPRSRADGVGRTHNSQPPGGHRVMRLLDVLLSSALLVFLLPVFVLIALGISLFDRGPIFFAHRRVGRDGAPFRCLKFRSMYVGAEERLKSLLAENPSLRIQWDRDQKLDNDPRITPLGHILRVTSLDELPQLINVLRGEMSLVGPRPIVDAEVPRYGRFIGCYYQMRPGITGLWQVMGRSDTSYRRRIAIDVHYARSKCLMLDMRIMLATVPAVLLGRGSA